MTSQAQDTSVRTEVVVDAPAERAFRLFTERFDQIKPREHNMLGVDIAESVFEPREGGRVYDRGVDGSECHWGRVLTYDPPDRIVFTWDINPQWQIESDLDRASEVEVRFISDGPTRTRVELEHRKPRPPRRRLGGHQRGCAGGSGLAALPPALCLRGRRSGLNDVFESARARA